METNESEEQHFIPFIRARCCINCASVFDITKSRFFKINKMQFCSKKCYDKFTLIERPDTAPTVIVSKEEAKEFPDRKRTITARQRFIILRRDCFKCVYCGRSPKKDKVILHVDHLIPWSHGGNTTVDNLVTSCMECNLGKKDSEFDESTLQKLKEEIYEKINRYY